MIGAIIQARIRSARLPRKAVIRIEGKTVLEHVIKRVSAIKYCRKVILATTDRKEDDILEEIARRLGALVFRGSFEDVLARYCKAAKLFGVKDIVRITGDCPLMDPSVAEKVIELYLKGKHDYVSNVRPPTYPDGMDVEVFNFRSLQKSCKEASLKSEREHVTSYICKHPESFSMGNVAADKDYSAIRLTLDEKEDLVLIQKIYKELYKENPLFGLKEILALFQRKPEMAETNRHIKRNEGYFRSIKEDGAML